jgi:ABC-type microcin C transport system permease subunit YejB
MTLIVPTMAGLNALSFNSFQNVMAGPVPAIQTRRRFRRGAGGEGVRLAATASFLGGRDRPGHDVLGRGGVK